MFGNIQEKWIALKEVEAIFNYYKNNSSNDHQIQGLRTDGYFYYVTIGNNHIGSESRLRIVENKVVEDKHISSYMS